MKKPKVALAFLCTDSYGRDYEIVLSTARQWYIRYNAYNGYGVGWTKWEKTTPRAVTFRTETRFYGDQGRVRCRVASIGGDAVDIIKAGNKRIVQPRYRLPT